MSDIPLHIMIIDDNPSTHLDFIKFFTSTDTPSKATSCDKNKKSILNRTNNSATHYDSPKFVFNTAHQSQIALKKIKADLEKGVHYALAFVDIRMPPLWDGIETIKRLWELDAEIQIIICTAYSDYSWEKKVTKLGMGNNYLFLKKPFDAVAVRQLTWTLTHKWILANNSKHHEKLLQKMVDKKTELLQESLTLLRATFESFDDGILVLDLKGKIIDHNSKFIKIWNIPQSMLCSDKPAIFHYMLNQLFKPKKYIPEINLLNKNINQHSNHILMFKNGRIIECCSHPYRLKEVIIGRLWSFRDITDRANLEKKLKYQAMHDSLTRLPNRILLLDRIHSCIEYAKRNKRQFAIFYFDLDRFKLINDSLTHEVGDKLLRMVAQRWTTLIRKEDTLARIGGDEFVMICHVAEIESISIIANKILESLKQPFNIANRNLMISTSIGISIFLRDAKSVNDLLRNADLAMYQAKERGGNQFSFYEPYLQEHIDECFKIEAELHKAIKNNEFYLLYQPQFNIDKEGLLSAEALIRWNHPEKGLLLPLDFISLAEETGLIIPIGLWVIREVCKQIQTWHQKGLPYIRVAVNITTRQLRQNNFDVIVKEILNEFQIEPQYLEFEITENVVITHRDVIHMLNQLQKIGIKIALDDFGTGNSTINYLKQFHIDCLKIDRSFIKNISMSRSDEVIIEAIISMARSFNFKVLAEGVESQAQMDFLKQQNCDEIQGFLCSKPLTASDIEAYLKHQQ